jgi:hypothetical protein
VPSPEPSQHPTEDRGCVFIIRDTFGESYQIDVTIAIEDLANNAGVKITVTEADSDSDANIQGLFFTVKGIDLQPGLASLITGTNVTAKVVADNNANAVGNINFNGGGSLNLLFDVAIQVGNSGAGGSGEIRNTVIFIKWTGLTVANLCNELFGVRLTTSGLVLGPRNGSSKIYGHACSCSGYPPVAPVAPTPVKSPRRRIK